MTTAERIASAVLREHRPVVHMTEEGVRRLANTGWRKRRGVLVGVANGFLRVKVEGNKTVGSFHSSFWRLP